ncbi:hypothetical protein PF004_g25184 [Phytophthora fragariae]|uniref:Crinkler effector protein N-terminal domain-containing protein n=1 Tax=Phytophthora fragariae TaxID=53985 RepID=A0A6G0MSV5_9STRA|nr:hypothetical protein PF004_g25184 [Phytophthora fragariae]
MAPILLNCVVVGEAGMVSVVIEDRSTVFLLKMAIKEASEGIAVPAKKLQLFLAKQDAAWMNSAAAEAVQLDDDGNLTGFEPMDANLWLNHDKHFGTNFTPKEGQIHVRTRVAYHPRLYGNTGRVEGVPRQRGPGGQIEVDGVDRRNNLQR